MTIYNQEGEVIQDYDLTLGYLVPQQGALIAHHEAIAEIPCLYHYELQTVFFNEGHCIADIEPDDPRIIVINDQTGEFDFKTEQGWTVRHTVTKKVIDQEYVAGRAAWDEYEQDYVYTLYTEEELEVIKVEEAERVAAEAKEQRRQQFLQSGYEQLDELTLAIADLIGA